MYLHFNYDNSFYESTLNPQDDPNYGDREFLRDWINTKKERNRLRNLENSYNKKATLNRGKKLPSSAKTKLKGNGSYSKIFKAAYD